MAGRGGKSSSLTREQLQSMGVTGKDIAPAAQLPPPLFPPLVNKPGPPVDNMERQYKIMWKDDYINFLQGSPYFTLTKTEKLEKSDSEVLQKAKDKPNYCWNLMPPELKPNFKRSITSKPTSTAKPNMVKRSRKGITVEETLQQLEEKERNAGMLETSKIKGEPDEDEEMEEEVQEDNEMDEENDYGNSYFDNGEEFNEEDDNLDDGPVY